MEQCFVSGKIFTGNPENPWAEAILSENGRIKAVGSDQFIQGLMSSNAQVTNLENKCVLPGLTDSHCHFVRRGQTLGHIDLNQTNSIEECRGKLKKTLENKKNGMWIQGFGWNENFWMEKRPLHKSDLDDIAPDNPVILFRACSHSICVNSIALKMAGITRETPDPPGGLIEKDSVTGEPTGVIKEARHLIVDHIPEPSEAEMEDAALAAQKEALKYGITSVHTHEMIRAHDALKNLENENTLKLRIFHSLPIHELELITERNISPDKGTDRIWYGHIKLFADGSLGARTAYLHQPYENETSCGLPFLDVDDLSASVEKAHSMGFGVAIHAIGDKAVSNSLEAIHRSRSKEIPNVSDRIEHIQLVRSSDLDLFVQYGVFAAVQPVFLPTDMDLAETLWGIKRCENAYKWKSILDKGIPAVFGSDAPIEPSNPMLGIHAAVNRTKLDHTPKGGWFPEQKLTLEQCIRGYTLTAATLSGREHLAGSIEKGKFTDFTVLNDDIFEIPLESIKDVTCAMTVINGEIVHQID